RGAGRRKSTPVFRLDHWGPAGARGRGVRGRSWGRGRRAMTRHPEGQDSRLHDQHDQVDAGVMTTQQGGSTTPDVSEPRAGRTGRAVERVQTGVRMEKRLVKVLKALAELYDLSLGDLLEGIVLHAFAGRTPFSARSLRRIAELERIYGLEPEAGPGARPPPGRRWIRTRGGRG